MVPGNQVAVCCYLISYASATTGSDKDSSTLDLYYRYGVELPVSMLAVHHCIVQASGRLVCCICEIGMNSKLANRELTFGLLHSFPTGLS